MWEGLYAPPLVVPGVVCVTLAVAFAVNGLLLSSAAGLLPAL